MAFGQTTECALGPWGGALVITHIFEARNTETPPFAIFLEAEFDESAVAFIDRHGRSLTKHRYFTCEHEVLLARIFG